MIKIRILLPCILLVFTNYSKGQTAYSLADFYSDRQDLISKTDSIFNRLTIEEQAGQMIVQAVGKLGKSNAAINKLVRNHKLGGVILLNGEKRAFKILTRKLDSLATVSGSLPLLFSADAEPSLINRKIIGTRKVVSTSRIKSVETCTKVASSIGKDLQYIGVKHNYAPDCDLTTKNKAIGNRSFGSNQDTVILFSDLFIKQMHAQGIVATAKHFPGHGFVKGDSHTQSVFIDGEMKELDVYIALIDSGVITIMAGHITVRNNPDYDTEGLPSTCSPIIIKKLLKEELKFKGLVITDAMNMAAATSIPNATLKAAMAGCDIILMPVDETATINSIVNEMAVNEEFRNQAGASVKKIIRLKICLGLL